MMLAECEGGTVFGGDVFGVLCARGHGVAGFGHGWFIFREQMVTGWLGDG